jgi:7-keto-8-aminopelargonate synthetase-like enzyme
MASPLRELVRSLQRTGLSRYLGSLFRDRPDLHMKDLTAEASRPGRGLCVEGRWVVNFGSDSFLGLDEDPRLHAAITRGLQEWGTHNGTSRAFWSAGPNVIAEEKIAHWLGTEASLIYPSVTLANHGAIPALLTRHDVAVADRHAHNSIQEGLRLAAARGTRVAQFAHNDPDDLDRTLAGLEPYRHALIAVDGVYSMSGQVAPLADLLRVARARRAVLYVDDAHGTGVLGTQGRGTVRDALGDYEDVIVAGSLSKAFSALGGFVACDQETQQVLKFRSNPLLFGGPVPPPYLVAVCVAVEIIASDEYHRLRTKLDANVRQLLAGIAELGLPAQGGLTPIVSIPIGAADDTLRAGRFLFDRGYYVQSVIFPAVPHHAGVLRIQVNANHTAKAIAGLLGALAELKRAADVGGATAAA